MSIDLKAVQTNIVHLDISDLGVTSDLFVSKLEEEGVLALTMGKSKVRLVTHRGIEEQHVRKALDTTKSVARKIERKRSKTGTC